MTYKKIRKHETFATLIKGIIMRFILYAIGTIISLLLVFVLLLLSFILLLFISSLFVNTEKFYDKNSRYYRFLINASVFLLSLLGRICIHKTGMEKIPEGTRFVLVGNHMSNYDPILQWYVLRKYDIAFISKIENFSVPIFGRLIRKCCFRAINRENPAKAMDAIKEASKLVKNDEVSFGVYPEGTRGDGTKLLPFHNGVFYIAKNAKVPIVVMSTKGTREIHKNIPFRKSDVYFDVVDIIDADFVKSNNTKAIGERVRQSLQKQLDY